MLRPLRTEPVAPAPPPATARRRWTAGDIAYVVLPRGHGAAVHGARPAEGLRPLRWLVVPLVSRIGVAGVLELVGGLLLVLGLFTRPVVLVLAGEMLVAYVIAHLPRGMVPLQNGGELALLYALIFVFLALTPRARD